VSSLTQGFNDCSARYYVRTAQLLVTDVQYTMSQKGHQTLSVTSSNIY